MPRIPFPRLPQTSWQGHSKDRPKRRFRYTQRAKLGDLLLITVPVLTVLSLFLFYSLPWFFALPILLVVIAMMWLAAQPAKRSPKPKS